MHAAGVDVQVCTCTSGVLSATQVRRLGGGPGRIGYRPTPRKTQTRQRLGYTGNPFRPH
jgi:hypothetical protein